MTTLAADLFVRGVPRHTYSEVPLSYLHVRDGPDGHLDCQNEGVLRSGKKRGKESEE